MTLFDESVELTAPPRRRMSGRTKGGYIALAVALVAMFTLSLLPSGYVIQRPGPVVNTLGETEDAEGAEVPLISVGGGQTEYPTSGTLSLTTVQVVGNREGTPSWFELAGAWFDPSQAVMPLDSVFPPDVSTEDRQAADATAMVNSQDAAAVAALTYLGQDIATAVVVAAEPEGGTPAAGTLHADDVITAVNGAPVSAMQDVIDAVRGSDGAPVSFSITRNGAPLSADVVPEQVTAEDGSSVWRVGASLTEAYDLPFPVDIQLNNIGGPSAGQMFALGIIDVLTKGEMTGGAKIAGTGTIDAAGVIGPIGGIRQKLYGARDAGNDYFLAPAANCDEVVGHVPSGLTVIKTEKLSDSVAYVEAIASGEGVSELPTCTAQ